MEINTRISKANRYKLVDIFRITLWGSVTILCIGVFLWNLSVRYWIFQQTCTTLQECIDPGQLLTADEIALKKFGLSISFYSFIRIMIDFFLGSAIFIISIMIYLKKYRDWFALFVSISIMASGNVITINTIRAIYPSMDFLFNLIIFLASGYVIFFYVFPNGKFVPKWTFFVACLWMITTIGRTVFTGSPIDPFTWPPFWNFSGWIAFHVIALGSQIFRYKHHSNSIEKQQTKWFLFGLTTMVGGIILESVIDNSQQLFAPGLSKVTINVISEMLISLLLIGIPVSIGIAMQKYRLWDIDYIINRTLVYMTLSAGVIIFYIAVVGGISVLFQTSGNVIGSFLASALVAVIFHPLRTILQNFINRLMYGERDNSYTVITQLGQRLESSVAVHDILPAAVETLANALKLPYAAVTMEENGEEVMTASYGNLKEPILKIPLIHQSESMGTLLLSTRTLHDEFSSQERKLLNDLAPQIAIAVNNVRLEGDLQRARTKLVSAREEERKRLRRDLHDSLGPELAGLTMQMDAARNLLYRNPEKVFDLLTQMNQKLKLTIEEIREIVYALRPPILDEFGLIYAIQEQVTKLNNAVNQIKFTIEAPESLPELSAAVEAASYRIVQEAVTNVIKHSNANACQIILRIDGNFSIEIIDDGIGFTSSKKGIGFYSMKERAEELGGKCTIQSFSGKGTIVSVKLPIPKRGEFSD